ncbi:MAG: hypothetical protein K6E27_06825 [Eubacterium sp.]|nr:hypothetical protein [Eubacterium sp.]
MKHIYKENLVYSILGLVALPLILLYVVRIILIGGFIYIREKVNEVTGKEEKKTDGDKDRDFVLWWFFGPFFILGDICDKIEDLKDKVFKKNNKK